MSTNKEATTLFQVHLIKDLTLALQQAMLQVAKEGKIPHHWDGHELRQWMADTAKERFVVTMSRERTKEYRNDRLTRGL